MKKINNFKFIVFLLFILVLSGCDNSDTGLYFIFKNNTNLLVKKYTIYEKLQGDVYINIENERDYNKISNEPIESIYIKKTDTIIEGKAIMSTFSREINVKPFMYYINSSTDCLDIYDLQGRKVFFIGLKKDLLPLYDKGIIVSKKW